MEKKIARLKRAARTRARIRKQSTPRLCVYRSLRYMYVQITTADGASTLICASTQELKLTKNNKDSARQLGELIAEKALQKGIDKVVFDRSGYKYHGRIKMLADAAREKGLQF